MELDLDELQISLSTTVARKSVNKVVPEGVRTLAEGRCSRQDLQKNPEDLKWLQNMRNLSTFEWSIKKPYG